MSKKRKKRKIKIFRVIILILLIILIVSGISILPKTTSTLKKIGYNDTEIKSIATLTKENQAYIKSLEYLSNLNEIIINKDFKEENLKQYIEFSNISALEVDNIIFIINQELDTSITYTKDIIDVIKEEYFIKDNFDRYITYMENNDITSKEVVENVNSNIDYAFYTHVVDADTSKGKLILVNKYNKLSSAYIPDNLVTVEAKYGRTLQMDKEAYEAFKKMWADAQTENLHIWVRSPYRSYQTQNSLYESYAAQDGYNEADTYSARPGYSEHQTGLAVDVVADDNSLGNFENTKEFKWMQQNAHKYGFILRYPQGKEYLTGYVYESWHYRYVGVDIATDIYNKGITFEEYYAYYVK